MGLHSEGVLGYGDLSVVNCYPTSGNHLTYYNVLQSKVGWHHWPGGRQLKPGSEEQTTADRRWRERSV